MTGVLVRFTVLRGVLFGGDHFPEFEHGHLGEVAAGDLSFIVASIPDAVASRGNRGERQHIGFGLPHHRGDVLQFPPAYEFLRVPVAYGRMTVSPDDCVM